MALWQDLDFKRKLHEQPFGPPNPVSLHQPHLVRPALQPVERSQQIVSIFGDFQEPLVQLALLNERAGAPAPSVDHLLIRQHRMLNRVPVDLAFLAVNQPLIEKVDKQPLLLLIIFRVAGRQLAAPVERQPHFLELLAHRRDLSVSRLFRMDAFLQGGVFRGQAERIPAHRMHHIIALGAHVAGDHVAHRIIAHVADMDASRRIWEHFKNIVFRTRFVLLGAVDVSVFPNRAPVLFALCCIISF